jgi:thiamine-phosphate pyrophosphorylase
MLRYAITSRALYPGDELERQAALLREASRWAAEGIDFIQLREKDLPEADIAGLAHKILQVIAQTTSPTRLLINSHPDIAITTGAHGVHLTSHPDEFTSAQVRSLYTLAGLPLPIVSVSCHTLDDVRNANKSRVDAVLFAPVFEKVVPDHESVPGQGLERLHAACITASPVPVFALGGVTLDNASSCQQAGAAGIAGIRLFHTS